MEEAVEEAKAKHEGRARASRKSGQRYELLLVVGGCLWKQDETCLCQIQKGAIFLESGRSVHPFSTCDVAFDHLTCVESYNVS